MNQTGGRKTIESTTLHPDICRESKASQQHFSSIKAEIEDVRAGIIT